MWRKKSYLILYLTVYLALTEWYWHNPKIAIWSYYYYWAKNYDNCTRHYEHTCQSKHTPLDVIIVGCSNYFLAQP